MSSVFSIKKIPQHLGVAGFIGVGVFLAHNQAYASNYGTQIKPNVSLQDGDSITADQIYNSKLFGVYAQGQTGAPVQINLGNNSKVIADTTTAGTGATSATGIQAYGNTGATNTIDANNLELTVRATGSAVGIDASDTQVDLGQGGIIRVEGGSASAIAIRGYSSLVADGISISAIGGGYSAVSIEGQGSTANLGTGSSIYAEGNQATGVTVFGANGSGTAPARFDANQLSIETKGNNAYGMNIQKNSIVNLGTLSTIKTNGTNSTGLWILGELTANQLRIEAQGSGANALEVRSGGSATIGAGSYLSSKNAIALVGRDAGVVVNYQGNANQRNVLVAGAHAVSSQNNAVVNVGYTDMYANNSGGYAIWAAGGQVNADNISLTAVSGVYGVVATNSSAKFTGNTIIQMAGSDEIAIISSGAGNSITSTGKMNILGSVYAQNNATTALDFGQGSVLTGGAFISSGAKTNLTFNQGLWNMTQSSVMTNLTLNNSTVDFTADTPNSTLTVDNLSGNGSTFIMRVDLVGDGDGVNNSGNKLIVQNTSAGQHYVKVLNQGSLATTGNEVLTVVETQDGVATFAMSPDTGTVELGGYLYNIRKNSNNLDWELYSSGEAPVTPTDPGGNGGGGSNLTSTGRAGGNFINIGYLMNYAETQALLQRMGQLRQSGTNQADIWVRGFAGKFNSFGSGKLDGFGMNYAGLQLGTDKRITLGNEDILFLGAMAGTSDADPDYKNGSGDVKGYHFGVYGTYLMANDVYIDGVLKYSHLKNDFDVKDTQYNRIHGTGKSDGYSASIEVGKRFYWDKNSKAGFYIEPQAQLSFTHQQGSSIADNGLNIDLGSYDSTLGRVSAQLGYEVENTRNPMNVYFKTGYVHEMSGDVEYRLNGSKEEHSFGGGWWQNGIGVNTQINKHHNVYLDASYATGSKFDQVQVNAGYRYSW
ncbi:autotransporter outer membrane beta-barrel domain-containing protein [Neisseria sp. Ec49-e6-T10]|uniref:autotransporter outer membrane beta-barrel domain-containing protein n=1 Tax=Neisseria sp. Ec49-e6-T10 TaxID=3140744 RepID=UPI003EB98D47